MATITARKVDDDDYALLNEAARENGRSISEELRLLIADYARKRRGAKRAADLRVHRRKHPIVLPRGMSSLDLLREDRESW